MTYRVRFSATDNGSPVLYFETAPELGQAITRGLEHAAAYGFTIRSIADVTSLAARRA